MAGAGVRFSKEGFTDAKPLVNVDQRTLVERSLECLPPAKNWVAVCQSSHLRDKRLAKALGSGSRRFQTVSVIGLTDGQLASCLMARERLDPEASLLIAPCDSAAVYDEDLLSETIGDQNTDCLVWTFRNHPHANRNPQQYGWAIARSTGEIVEIVCKHPPRTGPAETPGIVGTFWFRKARYFLEAADQLVAENRRINGEFYVDSAIKVLVEQGRRARIFPVGHYLCLGTPDDVRTYEYWAGHFHSQGESLGVGA